MGMFTKVIAFLDKAAGVPAWVTHADNIRKLEERGCPTLAKAIVEIPEMDPVASWEPAQVWGIMVQPDNWIGKVLPKQTFDAIKTELEQCYQPLMEIVEVDTPSSLAKLAEEVFAASELSMEMVVASAPSVTDLENLAGTISLTGGLSEEECLATVPGAALDPQVRKQLVQGMMKVISRGRKPGPTLKVLKTMACEDQAAITEALEEMAKQGNRLASAILEDPSL